MLSKLPIIAITHKSIISEFSHPFSKPSRLKSAQQSTGKENRRFNQPQGIHVEEDTGDSKK
jgi:hypothetical protein